MKKTQVLIAFTTLFLSTISSAGEVVGVIGAMDSEIQKLLPEIKNRQEVTSGGHKFYTGKLRGQDVVVTKSGVGKVNAAITATELINRFEVDSMIFTGVAGALGPNLEPKDVVISTSLVQHDVDLTVFGYKPGVMSGFEEAGFHANQELVSLAYQAAEKVVGSENVYKGVIATGDQFIADKAVAQNIHKTFDALAVEMEGGALAQVAYLYKTPLVVIRTISDKADGSAHLEYAEMEKVTADNSAGITLEMLQHIK